MQREPLITLKEWKSYSLLESTWDVSTIKLRYFITWDHIFICVDRMSRQRWSWNANLQNWTAEVAGRQEPFHFFRVLPLSPFPEQLKEEDSIPDNALHKMFRWCGECVNCLHSAAGRRRRIGGDISCLELKGYFN